MWSKTWKYVVYLRPALRIDCRGDHLWKTVDRSLPRLTGAFFRAWLRLRHGAFWGCAPAPLTKLDLIDWLIDWLVQLQLTKIIKGTHARCPASNLSWYCYFTSQRVYKLINKILSIHILLLNENLWAGQVKTSHMPLQLCCHDMSEVVNWLDE